jgi:hypothetical protein
MRLTYIGPTDGVEVPMPDGTGDITVAHGHSAEFPDKLAHALLEQPDNWKKTKAAAPPGKE